MKLYLNEDDCLAVISSSEQSPAAAASSRIVQEYVDKPLLVSGYKSHIRLYVLITSTDPLRLFIYQDGLMQLASEKYLNPAEGNLVSVNFLLFSIFCYKPCSKKSGTLCIF